CPVDRSERTAALLAASLCTPLLGSAAALGPALRLLRVSLPLRLWVSVWVLSARDRPWPAPVRLPRLLVACTESNGPLSRRPRVGLSGLGSAGPSSSRGTRPVTDAPCSGLVPHVTIGGRFAASSLISRSNTAPSSECSVSQ